MRRAERVFRFLLLAYPARLRNARAHEMWAAFRNHLEDAKTDARRFAVTTVWVQEIVAAITNGRRARIMERHRHRQTKLHTPLGAHVHALIRDLRYAFRALRKSPGYAATVIATLTIGIGSSVAIFTIVRGVLLTPLDYEQPERLHSIWLRDANNAQSPLAAADFADLVRLTTSFDEVAGRWSQSTSLLGEGEPESVSVAWVSDNYFRTLGLTPELGRDFDAGELDAVVLSGGLWRRRFGADSTIIGRTVRLANNPMTVVGVLPGGVNPNVATVGGRRETNDIFRVWPADDWINDDRVVGWIRVIARAGESVNDAQITADLQTITQHTVEMAPERMGTEFQLYAVGVLDEIVSAAKPYLLTLAAGVGFVFLIACFNVTNLSLVRSHLRNKEMTIRAAMGAGRATLARQLFVESLTVALMGGVGAIALAHFATQALVALEPTNLPRMDNIHLDTTVLLFTVLTAVAAAVIVGVVPAWRATKTTPGGMLQERASTGTKRQRRFANLLIASEVALSLLLLTGSGLLLRTFVQLAAVDPGFEPEQLITYSLSNNGVGGQEEGQQFIRDVIRETKAIPGVEFVAFTNRFPFAGGLYSGPYATDATFDENKPKKEASFRWVTPEFFDAMGARLLAGRFMTETDGPEVAVIDDVMARAAWPDTDPVGQRIWTGQLGREDWSTVIGVVQQMRHEDLTAPGQETVFMPSEHQVGNVMRAAVRISGNPSTILPAVREVVRTLEPDATIGTPRTATDLLKDVLAPARFAMTLIGAFAAVALLLAAVGIFSIVSFASRQRTREFGLRMALGESPQHIFRHVVRQGLVVTVAGITMGILSVAVLAQFLESLLFGVQPIDPASLTVGATVMIMTGMLGGWLPARRAARVDPATTLKAE